MSNNSTTFAQQLIGMYTDSIGNWSYYIIAIAAFSTMFSTSITVMDGYSRAMSRATRLLFKGGKEDSRTVMIIWTIVLTLGTWLVSTQFVNSLKSLVDLATIVSFLIAPFAGFLNYKMVFSSEIKGEHVPPAWLKYLAISGMVFLGAFTVYYIYILLAA